MNNPGPPKELEGVVGALLPPACREQVLGDLAERYRNNWEYLAEALQVIPLLVASRMRRAADPQMLVIEASAAYFCFLGVAWQFEGSLFLFGGAGILLVAIAALTTVGIVWLLDVYGGRSDRVRAAAVAAAPVLLAQLLLALVEGLHRPRLVLILGGLSSLLVISGLRSLLAPGAWHRFRQSIECRTEVDPRMSPDQMRTAALRMYKRTRAVRIVVTAGKWIPLVTWGFSIRHSPGLVFELGRGILIGATVYSGYILEKAFARGGRLDAQSPLAACVQFCRHNLAGRRDILRSAWPQLIGPLLAGTLLLLAAHPAIPSFWERAAWLALATLFYAAVGWFARIRIPTFQRQIDALDAATDR